MEHRLLFALQRKSQSQKAKVVVMTDANDVDCADAKDKENAAPSDHK
ncbi:MAG: hypothetical protein KGK08_14765 [Acidobacteriota bacterium]|nr:hypothetical protein [Acidobacteriota bacterium]